jgi:hypothetical protein
MGLIFDLDHPAPLHATPPTGREWKQRPRIEADTPIVPQAVAMGVWEEACVWLDEELPREWVKKLVVRANFIYAHNPRFRQSIRRPGNAGRDFLWIFIRHWLCAMIRKHNRDWHARLPERYNVGADLPCRSATLVSCSCGCLNTRPKP